MPDKTLVEKCQEAYKREFLSGGTTESTYGAMIKTVLEEMHDSEEAQHEYVSPTEFVKNFAKSNNLKLGEDK